MVHIQVQSNQETEKICKVSHTSLPDKVQKEIDRIKIIADIYKELQVLMPDYTSEYFDAFIELAERFENIDVQ